MSTEFALVNHTTKEYIWLGSPYRSARELHGGIFQLDNKRITNFLFFGHNDALIQLGHHFEVVIEDCASDLKREGYKEVAHYHESYAEYRDKTVKPFKYNDDKYDDE